MHAYGTFHTVSFLQETNIHVDLRNHLNNINLLKILNQDQDELRSKIVNILAEWDQLLSNNLSGYCWARTSVQLDDFSLVYVSKHTRCGGCYLFNMYGSPIPHLSPHDFSALQMSSEALTIIYGSKLADPFDTAIWDHDKTQYLVITS